jgi:hypothetical protein
VHQHPFFIAKNDAATDGIIFLINYQISGLGDFYFFLLYLLTTNPGNQTCLI